MADTANQVLNPPQTTTTTAATPPATPQPQTWIDGLGQELKGFVQEQGFKEPAEVAEQYRNLLKLRGVGADKLLRTPDSYTDAKEQEAAINAIYDRLGRPKSAAEYGLKPPEGGDEDLTKFSAEMFHKAGLSKNQAEAISKAWNERMTNGAKAAQEAAQLQAKNQIDNLKREWGSNYEANIRVANQGKTALGWDEAKVDAVSKALGVTETIKLLNDAGRRIGEGQFIVGDKGAQASVYTPEGAQTKIKELISDAGFREKLMNGDLQAKAQWNALHEQMASGQNWSI